MLTVDKLFFFSPVAKRSREHTTIYVHPGTLYISIITSFQRIRNSLNGDKKWKIVFKIKYTSVYVNYFKWFSKLKLGANWTENSQRISPTKKKDRT